MDHAKLEPKRSLDATGWMEMGKKTAIRRKSSRSKQLEKIKSRDSNSAYADEVKRMAEAHGVWKKYTTKLTVLSIILYLVAVMGLTWSYATTAQIKQIESGRNCCQRICDDDDRIVSSKLNPRPYTETFGLSYDGRQCESLSEIFLCPIPQYYHPITMFISSCSPLDCQSDGMMPVDVPYEDPQFPDYTWSLLGSGHYSDDSNQYNQLRYKISVGVMNITSRPVGRLKIISRLLHDYLIDGEVPFESRIGRYYDDLIESQPLMNATTSTSATLLRELRSIVKSQTENGMSDWQMMVSILEGSGPRTISSRKELVAAWDGVLDRLESHRHNVLKASAFSSAKISQSYMMNMESGTGGWSIPISGCDSTLLSPPLPPSKDRLSEITKYYTQLMLDQMNFQNMELGISGITYNLSRPPPPPGFPYDPWIPKITCLPFEQEAYMALSVALGAPSYIDNPIPWTMRESVPVNLEFLQMAVGDKSDTMLHSVSCDEACMELGMLSCTAQEMPNATDVLISMVSNLGAMSFLTTFLTAVLLSNYLRWKYKVGTITLSNDGVYTGGKRIL